MQPPSDILIVDDDAAILEFMVELLTDEGYSVRAAVSGACALAAVAESPPTLVLLDLGLPQMDGGEVLRQLRATAQYTQPIIIMSARTDRAAALLTQGATAYLAKPFDIDELLSCVRQYTSSHQERTA